MEEKIIKGIKYQLDERKLTAKVIRKRGYFGDIVIPETVVSKKVSYKVTTIGYAAFENCESLTYIYYYNTIEQWKKVELGECWNLNVPTKIVHCINDEDEEVEIEV